jgi:molybdopterin-guanine dinucleotide biosynthesis protein A
MLAAVLLAGGASRRMGRDKAELAYAGQTLIDRQAATLRAVGADECLLACREDQGRSVEGFRTIWDTHPDTGPASALADVWRATQAEVLVVLALDMPRMSAEFLRRLANDACRTGQSVVPMLGGFYEPLAAAWYRSSASVLADAQHRSMQEICRELAARGLIEARDVSVDEARLFANINTPEDYRQLEK